MSQGITSEGSQADYEVSKEERDLFFFYAAGDSFNLAGYAYVIFGGFQVYIKITSGMIHFLRSSLISSGIKKQNVVALLKIGAEYVAIACCCAQLLCIKQQLDDF